MGRGLPFYYGIVGVVRRRRNRRVVIDHRWIHRLCRCLMSSLIDPSFKLLWLSLIQVLFVFGAANDGAPFIFASIANDETTRVLRSGLAPV